MGGMTAYTINDAMVKSIAHKYPAGELIFVRGVITALLILIAVFAFGHARHLWRATERPIVVRSIFDGLSTALFISALVHMKLADLAAIQQASPLILIVLSVLLYKETVGWRRWTAIAIGFAGAMFVVKPTPAAFDGWALIALGAATASALREMQTRRIDHSIPTTIIALMGSTGILIAGAAMAAPAGWRPMTTPDLVILAGCAVFIAIATYLIALAFRHVDISVVAPFRYSYLITSGLAGYLVFNELPDHWSVIGALLIVCSGLYVLHRETVRRRDAAGKATPAA